MLDQSVLDRFVESCPAPVMIRATLENLLRYDVKKRLTGLYRPQLVEVI